MRIWITCLFSLLTACNLQNIPPTIVTFPTPEPSATPAGWVTYTDGIERQRIRADGSNTEFQAIRVDPNKYTFRTHYRPQEPLGIAEWKDILPDAAMIVNANFFQHDHTINGLLISDGIAFGHSYTNRGGTFYIQNGIPGIRSNRLQPYRGEAFEQAIQAFPMLVLNGSAVYENHRDLRPSRRSIIAQDRQGHIIIMVTPSFGPGLYPLSQMLPTLALDLLHAFNLDGGGSTMFYSAVDNYTLTSFDPVPAVLAAYPKG